ncbi:class I SAM-dependent methyltransferase [Rubinisphaera margarita]|uniref:class I SAM-dependent methyltransferase n=1 Tax=Rubinisphaera margarita TaxID=2909586 RepID=UPI001EE87C56|nr:class I SAM-dependent methyltransferase [Rubinisphaera margarita]MCG6157489.1 class I SAM-dependent methyltransferase [Rubinisphaera margarita]
MNLYQTLTRAEAIPGYMTKSELKWLAETSRSLPAGAHWAEIGSLCGRSLLAVGLQLPPTSTLVSVDLNWGSELRAGITAHQVFDELARTRKAELELHAIRGASVSVAEMFADHWFDVVFIDAAHDYDNVCADVRAWQRTVKPGGLLCGHDYSRDWPDVKRVVDELFPQREVIGSIWMQRIQ